MENQAITGSEWPLMECLWDRSPRTLMEIVRYVQARTGWAKSTITTMVSRMEAKGLIYSEAGGRAKNYYPAFSREEAAARETQSLLSRVYRGSVGLMVNTLIEKNSLTKSDIDELYAILQKAEEDAI
jgi:BlaI family penicillinase repressor